MFQKSKRKQIWVSLKMFISFEIHRHKELCLRVSMLHFCLLYPNPTDDSLGLECISFAFTALFDGNADFRVFTVFVSEIQQVLTLDYAVCFLWWLQAVSLFHSLVIVHEAPGNTSGFTSASGPTWINKLSDHITFEEFIEHQQEHRWLSPNISTSR